MCSAHLAPVGTLHHYFVANALNALGACAFQQFNTLIEEGFFEYSSGFWVFSRKHLLTAHNERDLCTKRSKHVHEFHTCYSGTHHRNALGKDFWRVALTSGENALAIGGAPLRNTWSRTSSDDERIAFNALFTSGSTHHHRMWVDKACFTANHANALAVEQLRGGVFQPCTNAVDALGQMVDINFSNVLLEAHSRKAFGGTYCPTRCNHCLRGNAVEQVRCATHNVAFNNGDFGSKPCRPCSCSISTRATTNNYQTSCHVFRLSLRTHVVGAVTRWKRQVVSAFTHVFKMHAV